MVLISAFSGKTKPEVYSLATSATEVNLNKIKQTAKAREKLQELVTKSSLNLIGRESDK